jgi:hypothetical protein
MRKCAFFSLALLAVLSLALPGQASAQAVFLGAGATIPTGDYKDFGDEDGAKTGWMATGGVIFPIGENGLQGFVHGTYGSNSHEWEGNKTNLLGGFAGIEYVMAEPGEPGPFVFGEVGFLRHSYKSDDFPEYEDSSSGLALGGGAGYSIPLGTFTGWVLGHYTHGFLSDDETGEGDTTFFGVMAGVSVPIGG